VLKSTSSSSLTAAVAGLAELVASGEDWASCERYAPREVVVARKDGQAIPLELEFRPLFRNGSITQLMLLATDVSLARKLAKAVLARDIT